MGSGAVVKLLTTRAPSRMTAVLLNRQRHLIDVNLLDHTGLAPGRGFQPMAAPGTKIDTMIERPVVDGFGRERIPFVFRVSGLATDLALSLTIGGRRLGRLDDVRRRGLGGCRGILPRRRELLLEFRDSGLEQQPRIELPVRCSSIADNSDKTSVPWLSWLAMLNHWPQFRHNCTGERLPRLEAVPYRASDNTSTIPNDRGAVESTTTPH